MHTMIVSGLVKKSWAAWGIINNNQVLAYLNFSIKRYEVRIGFMMTDENHTRQGFQNILVRQLEYFSKNFLAKNQITVSTYDNNEAIKKLFKKLKYNIAEHIVGDRVDGTGSYLYCKSLISDDCGYS